MSNARIPLERRLLDEIASRGGVRRYRENTLIINEGEQSDSLFIVIDGRVKVFASNAASRQVVIATRGPGEYVGELALDGASRSASVITMEPTTCAVVTGATLREFIVAHPDFALHLIHHLISSVREATASLKTLALDDVYGRVARLLQEAAEPAGDSWVIRERLTQDEIADRVGASRQMVGRIFRDLRKGGYLSVSASRITLLKKLPAHW